MRVSVHELSLVAASVNRANALGTMRTVTSHICIRAKALDLALGCRSRDLVVVLLLRNLLDMNDIVVVTYVLLVRHVLLHRSQHRHVEVLVLAADVLHEVGARSCSQFHLVRYFVVRIACLRVLQLRQVVTRHGVLASVDNDGPTLRSLALPVLVMQDSATHGSLTNELHLLIVQLIVESETIEVCFLHSVRELLLLARPLLR